MVAPRAVVVPGTALVAGTVVAPRTVVTAGTVVAAGTVVVAGCAGLALFPWQPPRAVTTIAAVTALSTTSRPRPCLSATAAIRPLVGLTQEKDRLVVAYLHATVDGDHKPDHLTKLRLPAPVRPLRASGRQGVRQRSS